MSTRPQAGRWSRAALLAAIRRWYLIYHEKPLPRDWNASAAERRKDRRRITRIRSGTWPDYRTVLREFGSWEGAWDLAWEDPGDRPLTSSSNVPGACHR